MPKLRRRQAIELSAAALIAGPSLLAARSALAAAAPGKLEIGSLKAGASEVLYGLSAGQFKIEIEGITVPHVVSVDLGSVTYAKGLDPQYGQVKIGLDSAAKMSAHATPKSAGEIAVSLLAADGKTAAMTYHGANAERVSIKGGDGVRFVSYTVDAIDVTVSKIAVGGHALPAAVKVEFDGVKLSGQASPPAGKVALKAGEAPQPVAVTAFLTIGHAPPSATSSAAKVSKVDAITIKQKVSGKVSKVDAINIKQTAALPSSTAELTRVDLPKLERGSTALVTETLTFVDEG
jgi:hypothetical protein